MKKLPKSEKATMNKTKPESAIKSKGKKLQHPSETKQATRSKKEHFNDEQSKTKMSNKAQQNSNGNQADRADNFKWKLLA